MPPAARFFLSWQKRHSAPFSLRGKEKAAGGKKKTAKGDFDFPLCKPLNTTKKGAAAPFLGSSPGLGLCRGYFKSTKRVSDASLIDRRGSRNTLRLFRLPYVKYSTGANKTTRTTHRALGKPDSTAARRAF